MNPDTAFEDLQLHSNRPVIWKQPMKMVLLGIVGVMLVVTGHVAFDRLVQRSAAIQQLEMFQAMWSKATPEERSLIQQIASRQER